MRRAKYEFSVILVETSMTRIAGIALVFLFLTSSGSALPFVVRAASRTIIVPENYRNITDAVSHALDGDTILVKSGTYFEKQLVINRTLSLVGENPRTTMMIFDPPVGPRGPLSTFGIDYPIKIVANNVTISGFTITANGERPVLLGIGGDLIATGSGTRIIDNIFETGIAAIGNHAYIANNTINDKSRSNFASLTVNGDYQVIVNNTVFGIWVENSAYDIIARNNIYSTNGPGAPIDGAGIQLRSATRNQIFANNVVSSGPCVVIDCYIGTSGLQTRQSDNNIFYHNNFASNSTYIEQVGYGDGDYSVSNIWHNNKEGNYWDDYKGTDADSDGIGDTPYVIDAKNTDKYPLISPFNLQSEESRGSPWATKEPMPVAGAYFKAGVVDDKIYVVASNFTYEYDLQTWSTRKPMPTYRGDFALATFENRIFCVGGRTNSGPMGTNEVYEPASDSWRSRAPMPTPRHGLDANVVNGKIYLIGGLVPWSDFPNVNVESYTTYKLTNVNEVYDPATDTWTTESPIPNAASYYASAAVKNKIYIVSAKFSQEHNYYESLTQIYDTETDTWSYGAASPYPVDMSGAATVEGVTPQRIYVIGGRQVGHEVAYNQAYDPKNDSWSLGVPLPTARYGFAAAVAKGKIYAIGGLSGFLYNLVWANKNEAYDPLKDQALPAMLNPELEVIPTAIVFMASVGIALAAVGSLIHFKKRARCKTQ